MHDGFAGGDPNSGSRDHRGDVAEPTGPLLTAAQKASIESLGRLISEAQKELRDPKIDENLLKSLGMTREQFAAFVERYAQRIGKIEKMKDTTAKPDGTIAGSFVIPGSDRKQQGRDMDKGLGNVSGSEKLTTDDVNKLYGTDPTKVSPEYRKPVAAYFRAISEEATHEKKPPEEAEKKP